MNKKLITVFLILTILPVGLLSWLAVVGYRSEEDRNRFQIEALGRERLTTVNLQIKQYFDNLEEELLELPNLYETGTEEIRKLTRESTLFRQLFVLGGDSTLIYPSDEVPLSEGERDFLVRTKEIGLSKGLFVSGSGDADSDEKGSSVPGNTGYGWYTWYLGEGINFIFWRSYDVPDTGSGGSLVICGIELNRMAVISGIIRDLPATDPDGEDQFRVVLKDIRDNEVYIWGSYEPGDDNIRVSASAAAPLSSWKLEYYLPPGTEQVSIGRILPIFGAIGFVILAIIGLALYLYRESTREVREAYKKVSFVNQVSHELKTPLTNIRMYAELLESRLPEEDTKGMNYADIVISESKRLSRLIGNVLTFSKEQRNGIELSPAEAVPDDIVRSVVENFRPSLESKQVVIDFDLHAPEPMMLDRDIIEQVVSNLISNVEKYALAGKYMGVSTSRTGDTVTVTVSDKGPGVPKAFREKIFTPFFRISNKSTDGISGTGIGLSIVRTLTKLHSGKAVVIPAEKGTAVRVSFKAMSAGEQAANGGEQQ